jgi:predicted metal-binding membrane protein
MTAALESGSHSRDPAATVALTTGYLFVWAATGIAALAVVRVLGLVVAAPYGLASTTVTTVSAAAGV